MHYLAILRLALLRPSQSTYASCGLRRVSRGYRTFIRVLAVVFSQRKWNKLVLHLSPALQHRKLSTSGTDRDSKGNVTEHDATGDEALTLMIKAFRQQWFHRPSYQRLHELKAVFVYLNIPPPSDTDNYQLLLQELCRLFHFAPSYGAVTEDFIIDSIAKVLTAFKLFPDAIKAQPKDVLCANPLLLRCAPHTKTRTMGQGACFTVTSVDTRSSALTTEETAIIIQSTQALVNLHKSLHNSFVIKNKGHLTFVTSLVMKRLEAMAASDVDIDTWFKQSPDDIAPFFECLLSNPSYNLAKDQQLPETFNIFRRLANVQCKWASLPRSVQLLLFEKLGRCLDKIDVHMINNIIVPASWATGLIAIGNMGMVLSAFQLKKICAITTKFLEDALHNTDLMRSHQVGLMENGPGKSLSEALTTIFQHTMFSSWDAFTRATGSSNQTQHQLFLRMVLQLCGQRWNDVISDYYTVSISQPATPAIERGMAGFASQPSGVDICKYLKQLHTLGVKLNPTASDELWRLIDATLLRFLQSTYRVQEIEACIANLLLHENITVELISADCRRAIELSNIYRLQDTDHLTDVEAKLAQLIDNVTDDLDPAHQDDLLKQMLHMWQLLGRDERILAYSDQSVRLQRLHVPKGLVLIDKYFFTEYLNNDKDYTRMEPAYWRHHILSKFLATANALDSLAIDFNVLDQVSKEAVINIISAGVPRVAKRYRSHNQHLWGQYPDVIRMLATLKVRLPQDTARLVRHALSRYCDIALGWNCAEFKRNVSTLALNSSLRLIENFADFTKINPCLESDSEGLQLDGQLQLQLSRYANLLVKSGLQHSSINKGTGRTTKLRRQVGTTTG